MKNSLKQLFRTPGKTVLFFLLMLAVTLLLVFSTSLLSETAQRIDEVERSFTTIGTVEQEPVISNVVQTWINPCAMLTYSRGSSVYDDRVLMEDLVFDGADYIITPEYRPYYLAYYPDWAHSMTFGREVNQRRNIIEFTALEDSDELGGAHIHVDKLLLKGEIPDSFSALGYSGLKEGDEIFFCQCGGKRSHPEGEMIPLEKGKRYIVSCSLGFMGQARLQPSDRWYEHAEYQVSESPYSGQSDQDGEAIPAEVFPKYNDGKLNRYYLEEITEGFYESGHPGEKWANWAKNWDYDEDYFPVMPIQGLQTLPVFHSHQAYLEEGREITQEEYDSGALVCMVPQDTMTVNQWKIGDKVKLPLKMALFGPNATINTSEGANGKTETWFQYYASPLKADGGEYDTFWEAEYEIVGTYSLLVRSSVYNNGDLYADTILIPKASVQASDANNIAYYNYLDGKTATFQIPNGTIDEFDAALRAAVPEAESLVITYNDNGYTDIMKSLQSTRTTALLLFVVGLLAAVVIVLLLLYFFIVRERKRTAIERSLGMSKRQCRVSLLAGVLAVTLLAAGIGTAAGAVMMNTYHENAAQETSAEDYDPAYSLWLKSKTAQEDMTKDFRAPGWLYGLVPLALMGAVGVLSVGMVNRNLKVEPIYLLSSKAE